MPRGDRTGPMGFGPMTGRAAGYCAGFPVPGFINPGVGWGVGFGRGKGWRRTYYATGLPGWARFGYAPGWVAGAYPAGYPAPFSPGWTAQQESEFLKSQAQYLKEQIEDINERLKELEKDSGEDKDK